MNSSTNYVTQKVIIKIFKVFTGQYLTRFSSQFKDNPDTLQLALTEWERELKPLSEAQIEHGLNTWKEFWPPNVHEFKASCKSLFTRKELSND